MHAADGNGRIIKVHNLTDIVSRNSNAVTFYGKVFGNGGQSVGKRNSLPRQRSIKGNNVAACRVSNSLS
jgi:hypothetical protein